MKVTIDREGCIGCGLCAAACPEIFRMADDGRAEVYGEISPKNSDEAREAEQGCPVTVITVE